MRHSRTFFLAAVVLALAACGKSATDTANPIETQLQQPPSDFDISVSGGTSPTFTWQGGKAMMFAVSDVTPGRLTQSTMWNFWNMLSILSSSDGVSSPITYGRMPAGAGCYMYPDPCANATSLQKGATYSVAIVRMDGKMGIKLFKP